jgi:invasion protein IalB
MTRSSCILRVIILVLGLLAPAAFAATGQGKGAAAADKAAPADLWAVRCSDQKDQKDKNTPKQCEAFQQLVAEKTKQRVAELAVGYPDGAGKDARGVLILPLGMLLTSDAQPQMQIDDKQKFKFSMRYCTGDGCFAVLDINAALMDSLRKAGNITISGFASNGQPFNIKMDMNGFDKAMKQAGV